MPNSFKFDSAPLWTARRRCSDRTHSAQAWAR